MTGEASRRVSQPFELLERRLLLARPDPSPADNVYFRLPLAVDTSVHFYYDRNEAAAGAVASRPSRGVVSTCSGAGPEARDGDAQNEAKQSLHRAIVQVCCEVN